MSVALGGRRTPPGAPSPQPPRSEARPSGISITWSRTGNPGGGAPQVTLAHTPGRAPLLGGLTVRVPASFR